MPPSTQPPPSPAPRRPGPGTLRLAAAGLALAFSGLADARTLEALLRLPLERLLTLSIDRGDAPRGSVPTNRSLARAR